jgi:hypothetical protein
VIDPIDTLAGFSGFVLKDGRRGGFCWEEAPRCVNVFGGEPHRLATNRDLLADTIVHCGHRPAIGHGTCGARLYVALLSFGGSARIRGKGERLWLVVEVTPEHVQRMTTEPMILLERLHLLGCALPGVDTDLLGGVEEVGS